MSTIHTLKEITFNEVLPKSERTTSQSDLEQQLERSNGLLLKILRIIPTTTYLDLGYSDDHIISEISKALESHEDEYQRGLDAGYSSGWDDG